MVDVDTVFDRPVARLTRRPSPYQTSFPLEEWDVEFDDGTSAELVFKRNPLEQAHPITRRLKAADHDASREADAYELLDAHELAAPKLHARGDDWILIERIRGARLTDLGDVDAWRRTAAEIQAVHRTLRGVRPARSIRVLDERYFSSCASVAARTHPELADAYSNATKVLAHAQRAFIHGELYASNVVVTADRRVYIVDWETASLGPPMLDVAALIAGTWTAADRATIASAYAGHDEIELAAATLHLALRWLCAPPEWTPPREHATDWLAEAARASTLLGS